MSNLMYDYGRQSFLEGQLHWLTDSIKAVLVDTAQYTVNGATHLYLSDIPAIARVATSPNLANKTSVAGVADADDLTFPNVSGPTAEAMALYKDTGVAGSSILIIYIDTATGLPVLPNSGPIAVTFDNGVNKIFRL